MGFHAPQEAARVLHKAVNYARMGQIALYGGRPDELYAGLAAHTTAEMPPQGEAAYQESEQLNRQRQEQLRRQPTDTTPRSP